MTRISKVVNRVIYIHARYSMRDAQSDGVESVRVIFHVPKVRLQSLFESEISVSCDKRTCPQFRRMHFHHWKKNIFPTIEPQEIDCLVWRCSCFRHTTFTHVYKLGEVCLRDIFARNFNLCGFGPDSDGPGRCSRRPIALTPDRAALTIRASSVQTG